jgi:hypothetical protein
LLLRQALESALDDFWQRTVPGLEQCSGRVQLLSLPFYLEDKNQAAVVSRTWYRLSTICHYDAFELPPAPGEVDDLLAIVGRFAALSGP